MSYNSLNRLLIRSKTPTGRLLASNRNQASTRSMSTLRSDYATTGSHRIITSPVKHQVKPDPTYVFIQDPVMKELVTGLLKSERERSKSKINPQKLTLVEHDDYSLIFFKNRANNNQGSVTDSELNRLERIKYKNVGRHATTQTEDKPSLFTTRNFLFRDSERDFSYYLAEIYNETTGILNERPRTKDLNSETQRIIQKDLRSNPLDKDEERSYKIVVNSFTSREPQTLRVLVCIAEEPKAAEYAVPKIIGKKKIDSRLKKN